MDSSSQPSHQQRRGGLIPVSPSNTPRSSDKSMRDNRSGDGNSNKDKGVNVQVLLRCRPLSEEEIKVNTPVVISVYENRREVCAIQNIANKHIERTFAFDKVFGPASEQQDLYEQAVSPIVQEVLEGYNCTIFAYGQTGTGKTYTMEGGEKKAKNGDFPSDAGVIPRAVRQIFEILEAQNAEYSMKVTFLELYNEEITDLLAPEEFSKFVDDKSKKPIALMEDGKGGVFVRGLEEEIVTTANEIYRILEKGSAKRRTAETLLNKQSSRSHSVFSITIHIKESTPEGEELIKCGKLNLVDLAGSENISRSGAREGRAREAGEINKSLLTLGRVINALVEHSCHVPYRDSKLTRLLRDSLGGKTKTCIIATISPSVHCLEETLSTLDYAHRAKNIKNKPEVNQKMMKSALIKDMYAEIDRLKQEVYAAREKNGIYIPRDRYVQDETEKKAMTEKIERLELDLESKDKQIMDLQELSKSQQLSATELSEKLKKTQKNLEDTEHSLVGLEDRHRQAHSTIKEKEFLISNLLRSEKSLMEQAFELRTDLETAVSDLSGLFAKVERKEKVDDGNRILLQNFQSQLADQLEALHRNVTVSVVQQEKQLKEMEDNMQSFVSKKAEACEDLQTRIERLKDMYGSGISSMDDLSRELDRNSRSTLGHLKSEVTKHSSSVADFFKGIASEADVVLTELQTSLSDLVEKLAAYAQQQREGYSRSVETTRNVHKITVDFFKSFDMHASNLTQIVEESQTVHDQSLSELENKFEECAAHEERQLLEKVAELLASSSNRKKELVKTAVDGLRENTANRTSKLKKEMSSMENFTSSYKDEWTTYREKTETQYCENTEMVDCGEKGLDKGLQDCKAKVSLGAKQWRSTQDSLLNLEKDCVASVSSLVSLGIETNQKLHAQFSSAVSSVLEEADVENKTLISTIQNSLKLDHEAQETINSRIDPCCGSLRELKIDHNCKTEEMKSNTQKCLEQEYTVDEPSCSTPKKKTYNLPSMEKIEELKTPAFEELLKLFWDTKSSSAKLANGDVKNLSSPQDSRLPLTTIN